MVWKSSEDAMPWVGLYVCVASLMCTLAMAADAFQGFRQWKLWFPCRFFTINAASITLISIAMKLPVDLSTDLSEDLATNAKFVGIIFFITMLANFLPSLGLMNDREVLMNIVALGILIITIAVNVLIQLITSRRHYIMSAEILIFLFSLPWPFSVALTISASRKILQHRYKELHRLASTHQETSFSCKGLKRNVKMYWMMAETGNPQFAIASSQVSSAFGVLCAICACILFTDLIAMFVDKSRFDYGKSNYKWSIDVIVIVQSVGAIVGSIAPIFRCLTATTHFNLSTKWIKNHLNVFRVEKHLIQMLQLWKRSHVPSYIPGCHCKKIFRNIRYLILNICIAFQITVAVICNATCLIPRSFLILLSYSYYFCKSLLKKSMREPDASNSDMRSDMQDYYRYALQIEPEAKLSKRILGNTLNSITLLLQETTKKEPSNLMKLLKKSTGFYGVLKFDNDQVPALHAKDIQNCWSLVAVTLTAIALALPNIANGHNKGLLDSMREGLQFVRHIEQNLNENDELVKTRKAAGRVWTDVEVYCRWLQIDLKNKARRGDTSKEILEWLGDEANEIVKDFLNIKNGIQDLSHRKLIAAISMYRISRTILLHCNEQENWPIDEELFKWISNIIADLLCACFTNLPRVITMKCHEDVIEKREDSIRTAAQLLGRSKMILKLLKARQLPNLDIDSMGYIDKWHALSKSQILNDSAKIHSAFSSSNESLVATII
ncbi:unnamed protein product [Lactuca saligna]|uniref:Uncharacterized protein n=1 Tax=Lactuca saligna TaxID=75948 RepID=A0AA35V029_LACSI|nr:unnamed protein product [Lactuca saligna]